jgi:hypothetical protein
VARSSLRIVLVGLALLAGALLTAFVVRDDGDAGATPTPPESIQGPQVRIGDLIYNVVDVRILKPDRPDDAPYLVNQPRRPKGNAYLGVFLKIYNQNADAEQASAPGYLLEPLKGSRAAMNQSTESPYQLVLASNVPAGGQLPVPGTAQDGGPYEGAFLLYVVNSDMTAAQPFRLVVHTGEQTGFVVLPPVPKLAGGGH